MLEGEEAPIEESPEEAPTEESPEDTPVEDTPEEAPQEETPPPPPAPKPEDYIMFREGNMLYYVSACYIAIEVALFLLLSLIVYLKIRFEADIISHDFEIFVFNLDTVEKIKENCQKFKENGGSRPKNEDEENLRKTLSVEQILRREFE